MNSRQRVAATINHQEPDRVPIGEWGIDHDHVSAILGRHTYHRNRKDTTLAVWEGRRDEAVESMKKDYAELVERLDYDVIPVELVPPKGRPEDPPRKTGDGTWEDCAGRIYRYAASNDSIMCLTPAPARERISDEELCAFCAVASKVDESRFEVLDYIADRFAGGRAVVFRDLNIHDLMMQPFGGDQSHQFLMTALAPEEIRRGGESVIVHNRKLLDHCAEKGVMIVMQGHDFGANQGCIVSPESIRDIYFPVMTSVNQEAAKRGLVPFFHCCGNVWEILDDYVATGHRGYQSIQSSAGMALETVKQRYGDRLTLWAGIQCETLIDGSAEDVEDEVRRSLRVGMPGGGFIFGSTNSVQYGAKTDNYLRALDCVRKTGCY